MGKKRARRRTQTTTEPDHLLVHRSVINVKVGLSDRAGGGEVDGRGRFERPEEVGPVPLGGVLNREMRTMYRQNRKKALTISQICCETTAGAMTASTLAERKNFWIRTRIAHRFALDGGRRATFETTIPCRL